MVFRVALASAASYASFLLVPLLLAFMIGHQVSLETLFLTSLTISAIAAIISSILSIKEFSRSFIPPIIGGFLAYLTITNLEIITGYPLPSKDLLLPLYQSIPYLLAVCSASAASTGLTATIYRKPKPPERIEVEKEPQEVIQRVEEKHPEKEVKEVAEKEVKKELEKKVEEELEILEELLKKAPEEELIKCPHCEKHIPADSIFCPLCGKRIREESGDEA